jgi:hypothetical protein
MLSRVAGRQKYQAEMKCWNCSTEIGTKERIGFRDHCPACDRALHSCRNCDFYDPSFNNQCREPMTERVVDKERQNFCEYFTPRKAAAAARPPVASAARDKLEALFKRKTDAGGSR